MKILITGGAGFVGYHLAEFVSQIPNTEIVIIDNFSRGKKDADFNNLIDKENVCLRREDISKMGLLEEFDYIVHCAAVCGTKNFYEKPYYTLVNNIQSVINLIERVKDTKAKILFVSTSETYSGNENLPIPTPEMKNLSIEDVFNPRWSYASSKIVGEQLFIHGTDKYSIVRLHNVYGERMGYDHIIPGVMKRILNKQDPFEIIGQNDTRSFCYIKDTAEAIWKILISEKTNGKIINIGRQEETKIEDIYKKIFKITGYKPQNIIYKDSPEGSTKRRCPDISLLKELTGYQCNTESDKGIKNTWEWYKKQ